MKVTKKTVENTAKLAMLNLTQKEKSSLTNDFEKIISYIDILNDLDTKNIVPAGPASSLGGILRDDEISGSYDRDVMLGNASSKEAGGIKVPKILE